MIICAGFHSTEPRTPCSQSTPRMEPLLLFAWRTFFGGELRDRLEEFSFRVGNAVDERLRIWVTRCGEEVSVPAFDYVPAIQHNYLVTHVLCDGQVMCDEHERQSHGFTQVAE